MLGQCEAVHPDSLCIVMPAYNEEQTIRKVVEDWYHVVTEHSLFRRILKGIPCRPISLSFGECSISMIPRLDGAFVPFGALRMMHFLNG